MTRRSGFLTVLFLAAMLWTAAGRSSLAGLDLERYQRLREAERYQMDIAEKLIKAKKWEAARSEYQKFMQLYQDSQSAPYCQLMVGECYQNENLLNTAIKEYQKVLDFWPKSPDAPLAQYRIAECHWAMGAREKAVVAWDELIKAFPKDPLCIGGLWYESEFYFRSGKPESAVERLETLLGSFGRERGWEHIWDQAWDKLFWYRAYEPDPDGAVRVAQRRFADMARAQLEAARRLHQAARDLADKKDKKADAVFKAAVGVYTDMMAKGAKYGYYSNAAWEVGDVYRSQGKVKEAEDAYQAYLREFPQDDGARIGYGNFLESQQKWQEAAAQYMVCQDKYRGGWEVAQMYKRRKMLDDAVGTLQALAEKNQTKAFDIYWHIAWTYREFGKWQQAKETYDEIIKRWPQQSDRTYWELGEMYRHNMGKNEEAIKFYNMSNREPESLFAIADCYNRMKNYEQGIKTLSEIIGFFKDRAPQAQFMIAEYFERWGKKDSAIKAFMRVCDDYPKSQFADRAHDTLEFKYKMAYTGGGVAKEK